MREWLDGTKAVRDGEELDLDRLEAFLRDLFPGFQGPLTVEQFPSGFSNLTYLLRAVEEEWVLRRPPFGSKVKAAHDMGREYKVLSNLHSVYPCAPKPLAYCEDNSVIGATFYLMERVEGVILRGKKPKGFELPPETARGCCESLVRSFADLHALDYEATGLADLRREGSFVERNVKGWADRYYGSQTDDIPAMDQTATWLKEHYPADSGAVIIHNDFKFDNMVLDPQDLTRVIGVLDWEMCSIGDPLMDLGVLLSYWMEPGGPSFGAVPCFLTSEPGSMTREEITARYAELTGRDVSNLDFYYTFGLFKLAVIVQQIYYRYKKGLTKDERFAPLIFVVAALATRATEVIEGGKL